jgi:uncharacterized protein (UPF0332 family)
MDRISDLSKYRLQKAKGDLQAAKLLFEQDHFAQSINRSYYAIFHSVRALLAFDKFDSRKHSGIISFFDKEYIKSEKLDKLLSKILHSAEEIRINSDYDDFFIATKEDAEKQINNAITFRNEIEIYLSKLLEN